MKGKSEALSFIVQFLDTTTMLHSHGYSRTFFVQEKFQGLIGLKES